jgi:prepilin-type N-terminal cleavage/methylation domain-containing protein
MSNQKSLLGFTLVEMLVTTAVVGILVALTFPAIQMARDVSRRTQCADNLKQITTASQKYYDAQKEFPYYTGIPRRFSMKGYHSTNIGYSVQAAILPHIGYAALFDSYSESFYEKNTKVWVWMGYIEDQTRDAAKTVIPVFRCSSDSSAIELSNELSKKSGSCAAGRDTPVAAGNYMACNGSGTGYNYDHTVLNDGIVSKQTPRTLEMITDGSSNTIYFSEAIIGDGSRYNETTPPEQSAIWMRTATKKQKNLTYRGEADWEAGTPGIEGLYANDTFDLPTFITANVDQWFGLRGFSWMIGDSHATGFSTFSTPNPNHPDWCDEMGIGFFAARSFHSGGVNVIHADGSTNFVTNSINRQLWHRKGSMNDGGAALPVR